MFARRVVGWLAAASKRDGDTDGVAEALVCSAILGRAASASHRENLAWLLSRQQEDGTYVASRDARRTSAADHYRHVVMTASWALLATLRFE